MAVEVSRFVRYAPKIAKLLLVESSDNLPRARVLVVVSPLAAADGGDGGNFTISVASASDSELGVIALAGQLGGSPASPDVRGIRVTDGGSGQLLTIGAVADGQVLVRSGTSLVGVAPGLDPSGDTMSGDLDMGGHKVANLASGTAPGDAATYGQLTAMVSGLDWQNSVLDRDLTVPPTASLGERHIVASGATLAWSGHDDDIAEWDGTAWVFTTPNTGFTVHVESEGSDYNFNGTGWVSLGTSIDHAQLLNLGTGDPHSQYQLRSERDADDGFAGLDGDGVVNQPVQAIRVGDAPDPISPGDVWVNGHDILFQDAGGTPTTQTVERTSRMNTAGGYPQLDGSGRVQAAQAAPKSVYSTSGDQALAATDIGAEPTITTLPVAKGGTGATTAPDALTSLGAVAKAGDTLSGDLAMAGHKVTGLASGTASGDAATYGQVTALLAGLDWQNSVLDKDLAAPPGSPATGARYLVAGSATGAWSGHSGDLAEWSGSAWAFVTPNKGYTVNVEDEGTDYTYNGSAWVSMGATIDHGALLNLSTGDPHTQYQLESEKDQASGYAGLDANAEVNHPVKSIRTSSDPSTLLPGMVWVNGTDLKFRDNGGTPATQTVERAANKAQANGYASLDSNSKVVQAPALHASTHGSSGTDPVSPASIGAVATGTTVSAGAGLTGGGDLSANRTISITAFSGLVAKDFNPASLSWSATETKVHVTYDVGADGILVPTSLRIPPNVDSNLTNYAVFEFDDASVKSVPNNSTTNPLDRTMQQLADILMGDVASAGENNGRRLRKIIFQTVNTSSGPVNSIDIATFRIRAYAMPRGGGSAL